MQDLYRALGVACADSGGVLGADGAGDDEAELEAAKAAADVGGQGVSAQIKEVQEMVQAVHDPEEAKGVHVGENGERGRL
ncbi:unnamed protein product [Tilletia controversa]|uniref:Uncharacterized protein n=2 Tax=Tilletia TaxID=13289 RepID=A0A9N8LFT4_9BASI|nr:unnamed protein product [Tilletia caries]CAD6914555.1 unnamed protein product [Tilletia laevis]CAD6932991.1 unnamed protein product [Tilletia controversa]CAD6899783.1 unnamed protein product [Tilletia caries]CAD6950550.1 unnamed protein product [Tilletia caries]